MTSLNNHPISKFLLDESDEMFNRALESVMIQEENDDQFSGILGKARVIEYVPVTLALKEPSPTLTSRIYALLHAADECAIHDDFRELAKRHPAFENILEELRDAHLDGRLHEKFDLIESIGAEVAFERLTGRVTIGLNPTRMRSSFEERTPMFVMDHRSRKIIDRINGINPLGFGEDDKRASSAGVTQSTTYYVTFNL